MNCAKHPNTASVSQCQSCGRGLCVTCTNAFVFPICSGCNWVLLKRERRSIYTEFIAMLLLGTLFFRMTYHIPIVEKVRMLSVLYFYFGVALVAGFYALRARLQANLESMNISIVIATLVAMLFGGLFIAPFRIISRVRRLIVVQKTINGY